MSRQATAAPSAASRMCGRLPEPRTRARDDRHPILEPTHPDDLLDDERAESNAPSGNA